MQRLISAVGTIAVAFFITYFGIAFFGHPPEKTEDYAAWVQALGSILAILVAIWVFHRQNEQAAQDVKAREDEAVQHMLRSLRDEIKLTTESFAESSGKHLAEGRDGTAHMWTIPVMERPFVIYDAYIEKVGKVEDDSLRQLIVSAYGRAQSFVQSLRFNNMLIQRFEHADYLASVAKDTVHTDNVSRIHRQLCAYGDVIRADYKKTMELIETLVAALEDELKKT